MSVARGADWGEPAPLPAGLDWFDDDASATAFLEPYRRSGAALPQIGLSGGDLFRTMGGRPGPEANRVLHGSGGVRFSVDLGAVLLDGRLHWFLSHCVARRSWLRGRVIVAANAAFVGAFNAAPKAHPGDGLLDILDADPGLGDRLRARRRLPSGTHVPHPDITQRRVPAAQIGLERAAPVYLDGERAGTFSRLSLRVEPDAVQVWIAAPGLSGRPG